MKTVPDFCHPYHPGVYGLAPAALLHPGDVVIDPIGDEIVVTNVAAAGDGWWVASHTTAGVYANADMFRLITTKPGWHHVTRWWDQDRTHAYSAVCWCGHVFPNVTTRRRLETLIAGHEDDVCRKAA